MSVANRGGHAGTPPRGRDELKPWRTPAKLTDLTGVSAASRGMSWTRDGRYLAVGQTASPFVSVYRRDGRSFSPLGSISGHTFNGAVIGLQFSPDSAHLAVGDYSGTVERLVVLNRAGETFPSKVTVSAQPGGGTGNCTWVAWHPSGRFLAAGSNASPFLDIYDFGTSSAQTTLTKITSPLDVGPVATVNGAEFSPDGEWLAAAQEGIPGTSPSTVIYKRTGDTSWTKQSVPTGMTLQPAIGVAWSADSRYLALGIQASPYVEIYRRDGSTFTRLSNPATLPTALARTPSFSPDGRTVALGFAASPYLLIYKGGDAPGTAAWVADSNPANLPPGTTTHHALFSPDGEILACGAGTSPFHILYGSGG